MQISFNTYKFNTQAYKPYNCPPKQGCNVQFTSGYGADEFDYVDESDMTPRSNAERWRNIGKGIKMVTIDAYREAHGIYPEKPKLLYSAEECKKFQDQYYNGTDLEGVDCQTLVPPEEPDNYVPNSFDDDY